MPPNPHRPFNTWLLIPPFPQFTGFQEPASVRDLAWLSISARAEIAEKGRLLFTGTLKQRNERWRAFRNYVRQARAYDSAAEHVPGSSSALLHYYSVLNLAKAELLVRSRLSLTPRAYHGLSYDPGRARSIAGDALVVQNGVFPRLYETRVGKTIQQGTVLPIKRLLANVPEVGWELENLGLGRLAIVPVLHAVVADQQECWSLIATAVPQLLRGGGVTNQLFRRHYVEVAQPQNWRDIFAVSRRYSAGTFIVFEARRRHQLQVPGSFGGADLDEVLQTVWRTFRGILDEPTIEGYDALICPSLFKTRELLMPSSLARYALMFYVSSLVRYKPSQLDPVSMANQAWLLNSFTDQAAPLLLQAALSGIEQKPMLFQSAGAFRL
jgi:YaaC-like Protein